MLNEFVYCPRLFYYEFVEGLFLDNADTIAGRAAHKKVDSGKGDLPPAETATTSTQKTTQDSDSDKPEVIHSRSVSLFSQRLGVSAKLDLVEIRSNERSEEHTSELQSRGHLVCRLLLEKKKKTTTCRTIDL